MTRKEGRYEVGLPWRENMPTLTSNYDVCVSRLNSLVKRLKHEPEVFEQYNEVIQKQIEDNIIEVVDPEHDDVPDEKTLHCVLRNEAVSSKLRIVYNGSLRVGNNPSLNNCLHSGPSLIPKIFYILRRFRSFRIPLTADLSKAFLMISIKPEDREYLGFLWLGDFTLDNPRILILRFLRLVFGLTSSPFSLMGTVSEHIDQYRLDDPRFVEQVQRDLYMDDIITGSDSVEEGFDLYLKLKNRFADAKFTLHKILSSSPELMQMIRESEGTDSNKTVPVSNKSVVREDLSYAKLTVNVSETENQGTSEISKMLGHRWDCDRDVFVFDFEKLAAYAKSLSPVTKRSILKVTAKLFDPLGITSPIIIKNIRI